VFGSKTSHPAYRDRQRGRSGQGVAEPMAPSKALWEGDRAWWTTFRPTVVADQEVPSLLMWLVSISIIDDCTIIARIAQGPGAPSSPLSRSPREHREYRRGLIDYTSTTEHHKTALDA
jgi:hypothetical protein